MQGLTINGMHTFEHYRLKMISVEIAPPVPIVIKQEVPGRDGALDFSRFFGEIKYKERKFVAVFDFFEADQSRAVERLSEIFNDLNGTQASIINDADPFFHYDGRLLVEYNDSEKPYYQIKLKADLYPYKLKNSITEVTENITGQKNVICNNLRRPVVPQVVNNAEFTLKFGDNVVTIQPGTHTIPDLLLIQGRNVITCIGTGKISFKYQEGGF